jgi:type VI secretion system secreted protein VgrG
MPSPKDGSAGTLVSPAAPTAAEAADTANPGEMEALKQQQRESGTGKYGTKPVKPFTKGGSSGGADSATGGGGDGQDSQEQPKKGWIEVKLVDEAGKPVAGERLRITLPDGSVFESTTDDGGLARVDGCEEGNCQVTFPALDEDAWDAK